VATEGYGGEYRLPPRKPVMCQDYTKMLLRARYSVSSPDIDRKAIGPLRFGPSSSMVSSPTRYERCGKQFLLRGDPGCFQQQQQYQQHGMNSDGNNKVPRKSYWLTVAVAS